MAGLALAAALLAGCVPPTMGRNITGSGPAAGSSPRSVSPTLESEPVDPYSSTGQWLVPDEIAPGTYRVSLNPGERHGYAAVCGDYECDPFGGMISNDNYNGPGVMVVPPSAVMVELKRITLTPMGGAS